MKARVSSLNPFATSYIPLSRRGTTDESKGYDPGNTTLNQSLGYFENQDTSAALPESSESLKLKSHSGFESFESYGSSSHSAELAGKQALDVDHDMNLAYLQMNFPGVSHESLSSVYTACGGDMEATIEMLNQLELHSDDFTENLPDSLDIGDVSEAGSSSEGGSQKLKKVAVADSSWLNQTPPGK
uniref:polyadenylate-binding protein-interacting protein 5 n=1 Tax=Erigeron canadensis TaxID=72917 RepID=UPI001CB9C986|nr:polyadenylate-binding protein-interacting protein 5 [Erigeron canadensis]